MLSLSEAAVDQIFATCQVQAGDSETETIQTTELITNVRFSPARLEEHRQLIADLLGQLPQGFFEPAGFSYLAASRNSSNHKWTDKAMVLKKLFELGLACGYISPAPSQDARQLMGLGPAFVISQRTADSAVAIKSYPAVYQSTDYTIATVGKGGKTAQIILYNPPADQPATRHVKRCPEGYRDKQGQIYLV